jgi:hypothetical protein
MVDKIQEFRQSTKLTTEDVESLVNTVEALNSSVTATSPAAVPSSAPNPQK